jgi:hypothetical protein
MKSKITPKPKWPTPQWGDTVKLTDGSIAYVIQFESVDNTVHVSILQSSGKGISRWVQLEDIKSILPKL